MSTWRAVAETVIRQALDEAAAQELDERETLALVDSRYPFGIRAYHPYQVWLKARSALVPSLRVAAEARAREKQRRVIQQARAAWMQASGQEELEL